MAGYKVSYKILRQQGEDMKAVAKLVDGYTERVAQIRGKLGSDNMLSEVRNNLGKLREQLTESATALNTAGDFLITAVDGYTGVEVRQVKKVDGTKAHNRDFYKNPVTVASVGGAAVGGAVGAVAPPVSSTTVNYTDSSVNITYSNAEPSVPTSVDAVPTSTPATAPTAAPVSAQSAASDVKAGAGTAGIAAGAAVAGGAIGAGATLGAKHVMDKVKKSRREKPKNRETDNADDGYDPEAELKKAIERVKELESE